MAQVRENVASNPLGAMVAALLCWSSSAFGLLKLGGWHEIPATSWASVACAAYLVAMFFCVNCGAVLIAVFTLLHWRGNPRTTLLLNMVSLLEYQNEGKGAVAAR